MIRYAVGVSTIIIEAIMTAMSPLAVVAVGGCISVVSGSAILPIYLIILSGVLRLFILPWSTLIRCRLTHSLLNKQKTLILLLQVSFKGINL